MRPQVYALNFPSHDSRIHIAGTGAFRHEGCKCHSTHKKCVQRDSVESCIAFTVQLHTGLLYVEIRPTINVPAANGAGNATQRLVAGEFYVLKREGQYLSTLTS